VVRGWRFVVGNWEFDVVIVTVLSLVTAATFGVIAWRTVRREQLRSEARVASLSSAIDDTLQSRIASPQSPIPNPGPAEDAFPSLFEASHRPALRRRPLLTAGAGLAAVLAVVVVIAMTGDRHDPYKEAPAVPPRESLELLSMRSARDGTTLAITGLVRNRSEAQSDAITAVVSAFDRNGHVVASGSAPLATLAPGDESLFVVTIPHVNDLARYRVSFRTSAGVLRHVDRRADPASAAS